MVECASEEDVVGRMAKLKGKLRSGILMKHCVPKNNKRKSTSTLHSACYQSCHKPSREVQVVPLYDGDDVRSVGTTESFRCQVELALQTFRN